MGLYERRTYSLQRSESGTIKSELTKVERGWHRDDHRMSYSHSDERVIPDAIWIDFADQFSAELALQVLREASRGNG